MDGKGGETEMPVKSGSIKFVNGGLRGVYEEGRVRKGKAEEGKGIYTCVCGCNVTGGKTGWDKIDVEQTGKL